MDIQSFLIGYQAAQNANGGGPSGGGGGTLPAGLYMEPLKIAPARSSGYGQTWYEWNGTLYAFVNSVTGSAGINRVYRWNGSAWEQVHEASSNTNVSGGSTRIIEHNGKLHLFDSDGIYHATFDGTTLVKNANMPHSFQQNMIFTHDGELKATYRNGNVFVWNEADDTWTQVANTGKTVAMGFYEIGGVVYVPYNTVLYTYDGNSLTEIATGVSVGTEWYIIGGRVYTITRQDSYIFYLSEVDMSTYQTVTIGKLPYMYTSDLWEYGGGLALLNDNGGASGYAAWAAKVHEVKSE